MDVLSRLKLLNVLTALTRPSVFPVTSFRGNGICPHEPVQGMNLNCRSISGLEPQIVIDIGSVTGLRKEPATRREET